MNNQNLKSDFNLTELDKCLDLRQHLKFASTEKLRFVKECGVNDKVYYTGIDNPFILIANYREDYWYPAKICYNPMGDYLENCSLTRVNMDFEIKDPDIPASKTDNAVEVIESSIYAMRSINNWHYRIVKSIRRIPAISYTEEPKYTLCMVDAGHEGRIGEDVTITFNGFLHRNVYKSDLFDEPILRSEEMEQINIRYISQQYEKISGRPNKESKEGIRCRIEIIDDKDRSFNINCRDFDGLQFKYEKLINNDVLFLVAPNSGIGCIGGDIVEIAIKK